MKYLTLSLFACMALAQWIVPGKMIYDSERVIDDGETFHFKTQPIDPSDPFRGKYITLSFEANSIADTAYWQPEEEINITFGRDSAGFAFAKSASKETPSGPYLHTTVQYTSSGDPSQVYFNIPFTRFYLEESKAAEAENQYWSAQRDSAQVAYGIVKIGNGNAVLTAVMVNGRSVTEIVEALNSND